MTSARRRARMAIAILSSFVTWAAGPGMVLAAEPIEADGVVFPGMYSSEWDASADLDAMASWAGQRVTFAGTFHTVLESEPPNWFGNTDWILEEAWQARATPFANVRINGTAAAIASGAHDGEIRAWADRVNAWLARGGGRGVLIAPLQEMNGDWTIYGMDPANFKLAYRRFVDIFLAKGMDETKVRWVFAPNGWSSPPYKIADYYPGDSYVDVIAISAYNFGSVLDRWQSVDEVLGPWLQELRTTVTPDKPYIIAQTGSSSAGGDKDAWLRDLFSYTANDPNVVGFVYFNLQKETDWPVWNGSSGNAGWRDGMRLSSTSYQWPLSNWFQPGPLPFAGVVDDPPCPGGGCDTVIFEDGTGRYFLHSEISRTATVDSFYYGVPGDAPFMGDWDCDGVETPGLYRRSDGFAYLRNSNTQGVADITFYFGIPGDLPLAGDFNGDGCDTLSIYRPSEGRVYIINRLGEDGGGLGVAEYAYYFGIPGDKPFVGDFNGDGVDTVGLHRESTGFVYFRNSNTQGVAEFEFYYGIPNDVIMAGDWTGDGSDTVAVYRPSTGRLYLNYQNAPRVADYDLFVGAYRNAMAVAK